MAQMEILEIVLSLDFSKSKQDPPEAIKRIMGKVSFQPAFITEKGGYYPWPDTLEILFPELLIEEGSPTTGTYTQELPRPGTSQPIENISRDIIYDLDRKAILIPTLFFVYEDSIRALFADDVYAIALRTDDFVERAARINDRNAMLPIQRPIIESARMRANVVRYTVQNVTEETNVSPRDAQRHIQKMRDSGLLPKLLVPQTGSRLELSADEYARIVAYIKGRNRKRGNPNLSRL